MDKAIGIIDIVWWAYLGGRRASLVGPQLHGAVLIKFLTVTREQTGRKGPGLCGFQQSRRLRAGQEWSGSVDTGREPLYLTM